jgi:hypothetical protein
MSQGLTSALDNKQILRSAIAMSALGHKRTFAPQNVTSALPPNSDRESGLPQKVMSALPLKADISVGHSRQKA